MARNSLFVSDGDSGDDDPSTSDKTKVIDAGPFCICNGPEREGDFMIGCDRRGCERWHHGACVGIAAEYVTGDSRYICPHCSQSTLGVFTWQQEGGMRGGEKQARDHAAGGSREDHTSEWDRRAHVQTEEWLGEDMGRRGGEERRKVVKANEEGEAVENATSGPLLAHRILGDEGKEHDADASHVLYDGLEKETGREPSHNNNRRMFNAEEVEQLAAYQLVKVAMETALFD